MVEEAMRTIDGLFRMFLKIRVSDDWPVELAKMRAWVLKGAEK
jgi:recombination associated protein RdgC